MSQPSSRKPSRLGVLRESPTMRHYHCDIQTPDGALMKAYRSRTTYPSAKAAAYGEAERYAGTQYEGHTVIVYSGANAVECEIG